MLNNKIAENFATILSHLHMIPSMHNCILFSSEIAEFVGFQIHCNINLDGRLVYSCYDSNFKEYYKLVYKYDCEGTATGEGTRYSTTGSDSINDIAPGTIARILMIAESNAEEDDFVESAITALFRTLAEEVGKWEEHYTRIAKNTGILRQSVEQLYDQATSN
jgi:hypothetical protein